VLQAARQRRSARAEWEPKVVAHRRGRREARLAQGGIREHERSWVMKWSAKQGLGVVAFRWLVGGKAKVQARGTG